VIGVSLLGESVMKKKTRLLVESRVTVSKVMSAYTKREKISTKINNGR
jgi:hypothetical protein